MVTVEIWGKKFPLCLTVAALDEVMDKCGGIDGIASFLDGKDETGTQGFSRMVRNTAWLLGLLIREGEENRLANARFFEPRTPAVAVPDPDTIRHLLTIKSVVKYRPAIMDAIGESLNREIEAVYPKNAESGERS